MRLTNVAKSERHQDVIVLSVSLGQAMVKWFEKGENTMASIYVNGGAGQTDAQGSYYNTPRI
jgi:hypothetical protein